MSWQLLLAASYFALCTFLIYALSRKKRMLPSEKQMDQSQLKGSSLFGVVSMVKGPLYRNLRQLKFLYGKIFRINVGMRSVVVINDSPTVNNIINNKDEYQFGCWQSDLSRMQDNKAILPNATTQNQFVDKILRFFLSERSKITEIVENECSTLIQDLKDQQNFCINVATLVPQYSINIITKMMMNKRFMNDAFRSDTCQNAITIGTKNRDFVSLFYVMFPYCENSPIVLTAIKYLFSKLKIYEDLGKLLNEELVERMKDPNQEDFITLCLKEQKNVNDQNKKSFVNNELLTYAYEMISGGYKTFSSMFEWSLIFMSKYPDVQERVHREIVHHFGREKLPSFKDKKCLNYTLAVMDEIVRIGSPAPLRNLYRCYKKTSIEGLEVLANDLVLINSFACNTDPMIWPNPLDFNPDRFLHKSCDGNVEYLSRAELINYGIDKRQYFGERLAEMQFFLFFTAVVQKFKISFGEMVSEVKFRESLLNTEGIFRSPDINKFMFQSRDTN